MSQGPRLFSDRLDRVTFSAYFLGAVVPLIALAVVVDRFALPTLPDRNDSLGLIASAFFITILSLGSFFVLRRTTRQTLERMDRDNHRLATLLRVSSRLAGVHYVTEASDCAVEQTLELADAPAAYLFIRGTDDAAPALAATAGRDASKLFEQFQTQLEQIPGIVFETERPLLQAPGDDDRSFAALAVPLPGNPSTIGTLVAVRPGPRAMAFTESECNGLSTLSALTAVALHNGDLRDAQRNFFAHVTDIIVNALDSHLEFHQGHGHHVAQLANRLGRSFGLDDRAMERLHFSALLHDIGMLKLDHRQQMNRTTCDKHAVLGARMLARIRLWKELAPVVQHHHEWWDGSGYPDGISGAAIPLESRIIAVCDAFDSMTSSSGYRDPRSADEAMVELEACQGTQFDPGVVAAFRKLYDAGQLDLDA